MLLLKYLGFRRKPYLIVNGEKWNVYYGTSWFSLTGKCADYVLNQLNENKSLEKYFSTSYASDEMVVPTIVFNSEFKGHAIPGHNLLWLSLLLCITCITLIISGLTMKRNLTRS